MKVSGTGVVTSRMYKENLYFELAFLGGKVNCVLAAGVDLGELEGQPLHIEGILTYSPKFGAGIRIERVGDVK